MSLRQEFRLLGRSLFISVFTTTIIPKVSCNSLLRSLLKDSNTFRNRMIQGNRLRGFLLAGLAGICLVNAAWALDPTRAMSQYLHDKWGAERGFLGGGVYAICQSSDGYLWIGTE